MNVDNADLIIGHALAALSGFLVGVLAGFLIWRW